MRQAGVSPSASTPEFTPPPAILNSGMEMTSGRSNIADGERRIAVPEGDRGSNLESKSARDRCPCRTRVAAKLKGGGGDLMNTKSHCPPLQCEAVARAGLATGPAHIEGKELVWSCPNHDDRHPSLKVNPTKNIWMCGPCGASGNAWELAAFMARIQPSDNPQ